MSTIRGYHYVALSKMILSKFEIKVKCLVLYQLSLDRGITQNCDKQELSFFLHNIGSLKQILKSNVLILINYISNRHNSKLGNKELSFLLSDATLLVI
jgi:hypothetical protein